MSFLEVTDLNISYKTRKENIVASQDTKFSLERGEILGVVGESGSGKSTIANSIINLIDPPGEITKGSIKLENQEICGNENVIQFIRGNKIGFIFQDPQTSLNPLFKIKDQLIETIQAHLDLNFNLIRFFDFLTIISFMVLIGLFALQLEALNVEINVFLSSVVLT